MPPKRITLAVLVAAGLAMYLVPALVVVGPTVVSDGNEQSTGPEQESPPSTNTSLQFEEVAAERGLKYESNRTQPGMRGRISRAGAYLGDVNQDYRTDVLLLGGDRPVLFENDDGQFRESAALPYAALDESADYRSALFIDYDNDGWQDLVLLPLFGEPLLLQNEGGTFQPVPDAFETEVDVPVATAAADFNGDGCADVFIAQNGDWEANYPARVSSTADGDNGKRNYLFRGTCGASFERVENTGIDGERWTLAASAADFTGDGVPDIHAANDFNHDVLYENQGNGTFEGREIPETNRNGMASEVADITGNGALDIFVSNIYWTGEVESRLDDIGVITDGALGNNLLINDGTGNFSSRERDYGVLNGRWGWAAVLADLDNDGDRDLFHTTREQFLPEEVEDEWGEEFEYYQRSRLFERVDRDRFEGRSAPKAGLVETDGRGVGRLDFDGDSAVDLIVANADGAARLYENTDTNGSSLQITVQPTANATVLGTRVTVITSEQTVHHRVTSRSDFLSQDPRTLHVGVGSADRIEEIQLTYPNGTTTTFRSECIDQHLVIRGDEIVERRSLGSTDVTRTRTC